MKAHPIYSGRDERRSVPGITAALLALIVALVPEVANAADFFQSLKAVEQQEVAVETFQVLDLPLNIINVALTHSEKGNLLKCTLSNGSDRPILGLRYLLLLVDSNNSIRANVNMSEGVRLVAYESKTVTLRTPIKVTPKNGYRLELILEQVVGEDSIWEVLKAREALESYVSGNYPIMPQLLRVSNQIDVSPRVQRIY